MDTTQQGFEQYADKIESVFNRRGIAARIEGGIIHPLTIVFHISGRFSDEAELRDDISNALEIGAIIRGSKIIIIRHDAEAMRLREKIQSEINIPDGIQIIQICDDDIPLIASLSFPNRLADGPIVVRSAGWIE